MKKTQVLIDGEAELVNRKLITQLDQIKEEFEVTFDFMSGRTTGNYHNIVHFTTQDKNTENDGGRVPSVWCYNGELRIEYSVNGNGGYCPQNFNFAVDAWHSVSIAQKKVDNKYVYSITLDDAQIHEIVNTQPKVYQDVKVYASSPWYPVAPRGKIRNLKFHDGTEIDPALQCPECLEMLSEPTLLDCGDTYCKGCVEKLLKSSADDAIVCGVCHLTSTTKEVATLWKNEILQRKLDVVNGVSSKCEECEAELSEKFCFDCRSKFCINCMTHHLKCVKSKHHRIDDIANVAEQDLVPSPGNSTCAIHMKAIEYFCERCKVVACLDCMHSKAHRGHRDEIALMNEVVHEELDSLKKLLNGIDDSWNKYKEHLDDVEKFMETAAKKREESRLIVDETFEKVILELQKAKSEALKCIDEPYDAGMKVLQQARDAFKKAEARKNYVAELAALPSIAANENIVQAKAWVEDACEKVAAALQNQDLGRGNIYLVDRKLITSCEIVSLDNNGTSVVNEMLAGAKGISFKQNRCTFGGQNASGTF